MIALCLLILLRTDAGAVTAEPRISAASAVLMDAETGAVLFSRNADTPLPIASITKIMTGLLAAESCDPEEIVVVQPQWLQVEGSTMGLRPGECCSVRDLLCGLMLASGNDAAVALACHIAGDVDSFADLMNKRAAELGMTGTCFRNPHGLTEAGHCSTARDMGILACEAMKNPRFRAVVSSKTAEAGGRLLRNHNKLLWSYPGAVGVKTGYTEASGRTLVSCAERDGMTLVCVTLNDPMDWKDHTALLDWGFGSFALERPQGLPATLSVVSGTADSVRLFVIGQKGIIVPRDSIRKWCVCLPRFVYAPCLQGEKLGTAELYADGTLVYSAAIIAAETVDIDETVRLRIWEKLFR